MGESIPIAITSSVGGTTLNAAATAALAWSAIPVAMIDRGNAFESLATHQPKFPVPPGSNPSKIGIHGPVTSHLGQWMGRSPT